MKDVAKIIRKGIYQAIKDDVTAYDQSAPVDATYPFVVIRVETDTDETNNQKFVREGFVLLDIINKQYDVNSEVVEGIANTIGTLLQPSPGTIGVTLDAGFNLTRLRWESTNTVPPITSDTEKIVRKIMRFEFRIQQT